MSTHLKSVLKGILPDWAKGVLLRGRTLFQAMFILPQSKFSYMKATRKRKYYENTSVSQSQRIFAYNHSLLPNSYVAEIESKCGDLESANIMTGATIGYPEWNLLYYSLLCSLPSEGRKVVIVETGTNLGFSVIIMAQALRDMGRSAYVRTVDIDRDKVELAKENVAKASLSEYVEFHVGDSLAYLSKLVGEVEWIDFAFLDSNHNYDHIRKEFRII